MELTLGQRLKQWRERQGLSQEELKEITGVRQALISELETGKKQDTTGVNLAALAKAFGKTVDQLMYGEEYGGNQKTAGMEQGEAESHTSSSNAHLGALGEV